MDKSLLGLVLGVALFASVIVANAADAPVILGLPRPSAAPTCGATVVGVYGTKADSCIYGCQHGNRKVISANGPCALPTNTNTPTPTPTSTA